MCSKNRGRWSVPLLLVAFCLGQPAAACIPFPATPRLPGEKNDAFQRRSVAINAAQYDEERRSWQQGHYDRAERVFIAKVVHAKEASTGGASGRRIAVKPWHALKGELPKTEVSLRDNRLASCQAIVGGVRRSAEAGDYTIVFENTRLNEGDASVTTEIPIHEARDPRLIRAMFEVP